MSDKADKYYDLRNSNSELLAALKETCNLLDRHEIEIPRSVLRAWQSVDIETIAKMNDKAAIANAERDQPIGVHGHVNMEMLAACKAARQANNCTPDIDNLLDAAIANAEKL